MIPKTIHYCWFGKGEKNPTIEACIASWKANLPDFEIKLWDESNFDIEAHPFTKRMYVEKKFAFVADYARLYALESEGGIYLDTDMEIVKDISPLLDCELLLGEEEAGIISAGMIGAVKNNPYIESCKKVYDTIDGLPPTIPRLMTDVYVQMKEALSNVRVCPPIAFYPYNQEQIKNYKKSNLTSATYGVHLWNFSWGHPLNKFFKQIGIHRTGKKVVEKLGIKSLVKKILKFS
jgi:mannosyltransferase OCH1-like enzyme